MAKTIIMVSGYKRSGKDFVSNILLQNLSNSTSYAFANPMKDILSTVFDISVPSLELFKNEEACIHFDNGVKLSDFRSVLQRFGNEAMKKTFGNEVWVNLFISKIFSENVIVISDWRFLVEWSIIADTYDNVITIRVNDDNLSAGKHASENELDDFDFQYVIDNTAKDESVLPQIQKIIGEINAKSFD